MARVKNLEVYQNIKNTIIMTTIEIMVKQSVSNFALADVAKAVGMTKAAIYWYFPNKEALIEEVANFLYDTYVNYAKEVESSKLTPYGKIKMLIIGREDNIEAALMCAFPIKFFMEYYTDDNYIKKMVQKGYKCYNSVISSIITEGIAMGEFRTDLDISELTTLISGTIDGLAFQNLLLSSEKIQVPRKIIFSVLKKILDIKEEEIE